MTNIIVMNYCEQVFKRPARNYYVIYTKGINYDIVLLYSSS